MAVKTWKPFQTCLEGLPEEVFSIIWKAFVIWKNFFHFQMAKCFALLRYNLNFVWNEILFLLFQLLPWWNSPPKLVKGQFKGKFSYSKPCGNKKFTISNGKSNKNLAGLTTTRLVRFKKRHKSECICHFHKGKQISRLYQN